MGSGFPDAPQTPGRSTIAQMKIREYLQSLKPGGLFENYQAKAVVVAIYQLWDEQYRPSIADALNVAQQQVECDLMGDIRLVRHVIVHNKSIVPYGFNDQIGFLPQIWNLDPGELLITKEMINSLFEQLNATQLRIVSPKS